MARNKAELIGRVEQGGKRSDFDDFRIGDTVDVYLKVREGEKERIQVFSGLVIARRGAGAGEMFMVRRVVGEEGVERVFPYHSTSIEKVTVQRPGKVRKSKLYYMRGRLGKQARIAQRREPMVTARNSADASAGDETHEAAAEEATEE